MRRGDPSIVGDDEAGAALLLGPKQFNHRGARARKIDNANVEPVGELWVAGEQAAHLDARAAVPGIAAVIERRRQQEEDIAHGRAVSAGRAGRKRLACAAMKTPSRPAISFIVARADNGVIGRANALPWHLPADLRHFKRLTLGKPVVMGRKTFESIGRPLPGRHNIVLTRDPSWRADGVTLVWTLADAVAAAARDPSVEEIMIIGGAAVYAQALPMATRIYLTEVHAQPEGDAVLPPFDPTAWRETAREDHAADGDRPAFSFVTLERMG